MGGSQPTWYKYSTPHAAFRLVLSRRDHLAHHHPRHRLTPPSRSPHVAHGALDLARGVVHRVLPCRALGPPGRAPSRDARSAVVRHLFRGPDRWLRRLHDSETRKAGLIRDVLWDDSNFHTRRMGQGSKLAPKDASAESARQNV